MSVALEPIARAHARDVETLLADPAVKRFTRVPAAPGPDFVESWIARYVDGRAEGTREGFAIVGGSGEFLGLALVPVIDRQARTVELGYIVAPSARGRGVATAALQRLTDWALNQLGALRVELRISIDNDPSKRVAARCGYVLEGVLRSIHLKEDIREDTEVWSRLPSDPAP